MTNKHTPDVRKLFENFMSDDGKWPKAIERSGPGYKLMTSQHAWTVWQAAFAVRLATEVTPS